MKIYEKKDVLLNGGIAIKLLAGLSRFIVLFGPRIAAIVNG